MAKHQNLAMAPTKVSGQCGRLKCCLVYEDATYVEAAEALPKIGKRVGTPDGVGRVGDLDVLRGRVRVYFDGQPPKTFTVELKEGEQKTVEVSPGSETSAAAAPIATPLAAPGPSSASPAPETPAQSSSALRTVGLVTAGVGVVGLGVGAVFGLQAISKKNDANCTSGKVCPSEDAANKFRDATSAGNLSTVFFVAGGGLAVVGLTLFFVAPKESASPSARITPTVGMGNMGMTVNGTW